MAFDPNQVDPSKLIEALQDEVAHLTRTKVMVVAQANSAIDYANKAEEKSKKLEATVSKLKAELEVLKRTVGDGEPEPEVVEGTTAD